MRDAHDHRPGGLLHLELHTPHRCAAGRFYRDLLGWRTERRRLGAAALLEPREGPAGWRSVLSTDVGGEIALWQPKATLMRGLR